MEAYKHTNSRGQDYYLHGKRVVLRGNQERFIYYFARKITEFALSVVPEGFSVVESPRTGLPLLKKI